MGSATSSTPGKRAQQRLGEDAGLRNADIALDWLHSCSAMCTKYNASRTSCRPTSLVPSKAGEINLDIEMETGTGKTYVYIKTIIELHKRYGWSKYIVVVPSIAIREGVKKTFDITAEHFQESYGTKPRAFIYNSSRLHELETFSSDAGVQVMIINIQAFNSTGKDNRRIYDVLDDFQSRKPIDVIAANRPIVIIDEPQKIGSPKAQKSLANFNPLFLLRYSATHKVEHNKVHRLDALDAYAQKLVKKIAVRGITVKGLAGSTAYLYLDAIEVKKGAKPVARVELEVQTQSGIKRQVKRVEQGTQSARPGRGHRGVQARRQGADRDRHRRQPRHRRAKQRRHHHGWAAHGRRDRGRETPHSDPRGHPRAPGQGARAIRAGRQGVVSVLHRRGRQVPRLRTGGHARRVRPCVRGGVRGGGDRLPQRTAVRRSGIPDAPSKRSP